MKISLFQLFLCHPSHNFLYIWLSILYVKRIFLIASKFGNNLMAKLSTYLPTQLAIRETVISPTPPTPFSNASLSAYSRFVAASRNCFTALSCNPLLGHPRMASPPAKTKCLCKPQSCCCLLIFLLFPFFISCCVSLILSSIFLLLLYSIFTVLPNFCTVARVVSATLASQVPIFPVFNLSHTLN